MRVKLRVTWSFQQDFSGYIDRCQPERVAGLRPLHGAGRHDWSAA